jgi:hypothetical protein
VTFAPPATAGVHAASVSYAGLAPSDWIKLISRLGEIPDPVVGHSPSSAALPVAPSSGAEGQPGGNH